MARLPYVAAEDAPEPVADALRRMPAEVGIVHLVAHAQTCLRPFLRLGQAILTSLALAPDLRELAILHTARLSGVDYQWTQHERLARLVGLADEKIDAVRSGAQDRSLFSPVERDVLTFTESVVRSGARDRSLFSPVERDVLTFTESVVRSGDAGDDTYRAIAEHLSDREIVELTIAIGFYQMLGNVMNVTRVDPEPAADVELADLRREASTP
jgi:alkylhydroperoxidase family enzyme